MTYSPLQYQHPDEVTEKASSGCYVSGLYLEGARWNLGKMCLERSNPKVLIEELPILRVIPIEAHRLKLVVSHYCCHYNLQCTPPLYGLHYIVWSLCIVYIILCSVNLKSSALHVRKFLALNYSTTSVIISTCTWMCMILYC